MEELEPLLNDGHLLSRDYIIRLCQLSTEIGIGKYNLEWLTGYMKDELDALLDSLGHQDQVFSKLYKKYVGISVDDIAVHESILSLINSYSNKFGFKVDINEFLKKGSKAYPEEYKDKIPDFLGNEDEDFKETDNDAKNISKKKLKIQKVGIENTHLGKDARSIYMRLIKKFDPDLEKDLIIKERYNEITK